MTASTLKPDLCIIGASEAGRAAAMAAVAMGQSVVLIDDGDPSGGSNRDLMLELLRNEARKPEAAHEAAWARIRSGLRRAAADRSHARLAAMNIHVIAARARFRDPDTVEAEGVAVRARRFVLATGRARSPRTVALADLPQLASPPSRGAVIGGHPDAVSAAQSLARLGSAVALVSAEVLPGLDPELAAPLLDQLRRDGVTIEASVSAIPNPTVMLTEPLIPALETLALDRAGIVPQGKTLTLNRSQRTANRRVYAVGCPGGAATTAAGLAQVATVLRAALLGLPGRGGGLERVSITTQTDPEIAQIGLTEAVARAHSPIRVWRWPLGQTGPGLTTNAPGHLKVVSDRHGRLLGVGIVGPQAREMIGFWALALARGLSLGDLADVSLPVPSWSEAARSVALAHTARRLGHPVLRGALGLMRRFG